MHVKCNVYLCKWLGNFSNSDTDTPIFNVAILNINPALLVK